MTMDHFEFGGLYVLDLRDGAPDGMASGAVYEYLGAEDVEDGWVRLGFKLNGSEFWVDPWIVLAARRRRVSAHPFGTDRQWEAAAFCAEVLDINPFSGSSYADLCAYLSKWLPTAEEEARGDAAEHWSYDWDCGDRD